MGENKKSFRFSTIRGVYVWCFFFFFFFRSHELAQCCEAHSMLTYDHWNRFCTLFHCIVISIHRFFFLKWSIYKRRVFSSSSETESTNTTMRKNNRLFIFYSLVFSIFFLFFSLFDSRRSCTRTLRMGTRTATNSLVKRTAFSSAINIFPNEVPASATPEICAENESTKNAQIRPYTEVPGPKGLPLIGNSWRFAPLIGKTFSKIHNFSSIKFLVAFNTLSDTERCAVLQVMDVHEPVFCCCNSFLTGVQNK